MHIDFWDWELDLFASEYICSLSKLYFSINKIHYPHSPKPPAYI